MEKITDKTVEICKSFDKVKEVIINENNSDASARKWQERYNRKTVLERAYAIADTENPWVLCVDPDERFETRFLENLKSIVEENDSDFNVLTVSLKELWGSYNVYRSDGVWNTKIKQCLFQLSPQMTFDYDQEHHIPWAYQEIANNIKLIDYNAYHLKMIKEKDRLERRDLYNRLDPNKKMQVIGYDYLCDTDGIELTEIEDERAYDYLTVPDYYLN